MGGSLCVIIYIYCYGNGPYWTTKYRISSDPPLNACLARLFGKMDITCVSGGVGCMFYCSYSGGVPRAPSSSSLLRTIGPAQSAERVWPKRGSETKGRSLSASLREACSGSKRANERETVERKG